MPLDSESDVNGLIRDGFRGLVEGMVIPRFVISFSPEVSKSRRKLSLFWQACEFADSSITYCRYGSNGFTH